LSTFFQVFREGIIPFNRPVVGYLPTARCKVQREKKFSYNFLCHKCYSNFFLKKNVIF